MSDDQKTPQKRTRESNLWDFFSNLVRMPRWQRAVMTVAVALAGVGTAGQVAGLVSSNQPATQQVTPETSEPATGSQPEQPAWQRHSPAMTKAGFGCIAGFILGWIARLFFKTVALITTLALAVLAGLAYFKVDTSEAEKKYKSAMSWVSAQGERLYEQGKSHFPGATSLLGIFMGFRRKTVK
jgi:uncharacterized membrane protein (Fun14 family)